MLSEKHELDKGDNQTRNWETRVEHEGEELIIEGLQRIDR